MKKISYIAILAITVLTILGCQDGLMPDPAFEAISFNPFIDGVTNTEMTKAAAFRSENGSVEIPAWLEVSDGIAGQGIVAPETPETKGTQINTTGNSTALATFASQIDNKFYVTAWKGATPARFIPSSGSGYAEVTYSDSEWSTITTKWEGEESATFFAYANPPASGATVSNDASTTQILTYSAVPAAASAQTDILLGYYYGTGSPNTTDKTCTAALQFHHPLTAVRFKKGTFVGTVSFKAIYIDGVYKSGKATMTASGTTSTISWSDKSTTMQEVGQEGSQYLTVEDNIIGESFLLIPQTITASAPVTVTVVAEIDGILHPLTATLAPVDWEAGKTYTYTLGYANYELTVDGEVSTDYQGNGTKTYSVNSSAPWKMQYTTNGGTTWTDAVANTQIGGWIKFDKVSGSGSTSAQTVTATVTAGTSMSLPNEHSAVLQAAAPKGTEAAPYDLSMHTIYGVERTAGPVTANSYVINAPGWYAFPLVYGNAIDYNKVPSGGVNTQAFAPSISGTSVLTHFKSTEGAITTPYISGAISAYPYWEDVPGYALIAQNGCTILSQSQAEAKGLTGCNCGYVVFQVPSTLTQGNAVIAIKDGTGPDANIIWSWHIWVTDMDLTCRTVTNTSGNFSKGVMPLNLGWVDLGTSIGYERKKLQIRFVQMVEGVVKNEVGKNPERREYVTEAPAGQSPTYQWGRKDPFIRVKADGSELTASEFSGTGMTKDFASSTVSTSIKNPANFFAESVSGGGAWYGSGGDGKYDNLWSATINVSSHGEGYTTAPVKTVYDPCPPGFQVPQKDAFDRFTESSSWIEWNNGFQLKTSADSDEYIFFSASGYRITSGSFQFYSFDHRSYFWTAAPNDQDGNRKYSYYLFISDQGVNLGGDQAFKTYGNSIRPVQETSGKY